MQPPYPRQQGHRPCTLPAMEETYRTNFFPHDNLGNGKRAHGRNENKEKAGRESLLSPPAFFYCFPRMQKHPDGGVSHRPARGPQCGQPTRKNTIFLCEGMCACCFAAPEHCLKNTYCNIWYRVKGQCPLWGAGVKPRMVSPTHHREIVCVINQATSGIGSRALPWCRGEAPHGSPLTPSVYRRRSYGHPCGQRASRFRP